MLQAILRYPGLPPKPGHVTSISKCQIASSLRCYCIIFITNTYHEVTNIIVMSQSPFQFFFSVTCLNIASLNVCFKNHCLNGQSPPQDGSVNGQTVMETKDPLYQSTMGQKTGLSFLDTKLMNIAYCRCKFFM